MGNGTFSCIFQVLSVFFVVCATDKAVIASNYLCIQNIKQIITTIIINLRISARQSRALCEQPLCHLQVMCMPRIAEKRRNNAVGVRDEVFDRNKTIIAQLPGISIVHFVACLLTQSNHFPAVSLSSPCACLSVCLSISLSV